MGFLLILFLNLCKVSLSLSHFNTRNLGIVSNDWALSTSSCEPCVQYKFETNKIILNTDIFQYKKKN